MSILYFRELCLNIESEMPTLNHFKDYECPMFIIKAQDGIKWLC